MATKTPTAITESITKFIRTQIGVQAEPEFLAISPCPGCLPADCFLNVKKEMERNGGRIQFGWVIWEWPNVYIEAEHHAVYQPRDSSTIIDITPCMQGNARRLFVPDNSAQWDYENEGVLRDNIRFALVEDPIVDELFKSADKMSAFKNELPGVGKIALRAGEDVKYLKLERRLQRAQQAFFEKYGR